MLFVFHDFDKFKSFRESHENRNSVQNLSKLVFICNSKILKHRKSEIEFDEIESFALQIDS